MPKNNAYVAYIELKNSCARCVLNNYMIIDLNSMACFQVSEQLNLSTSRSYTPDITPVILAAHRDNYEILKILLERGI